MEKKLPIFNLEITNEDESDVEVDFVALVDRPAIERQFLAFAEDSWNDYPDAAVENAKTALRWAEENGWGSCGEATGKARANQLANREKLTRETIARMSAFQRHRQNADKPLGDGCGRLMWLAWGGDEGIAWAERKLKQIDKQRFKLLQIFGGEGSGCHGDNCGRPKGDSSGIEIDKSIKNTVDELENGQVPSVSTLIKLDRINPKAASIIEDISYNQSGSYKELDSEGKKIFDKLSKPKDYELYRVDNRYNVNNIKKGDNLDFERSPTFVASDIGYVENLSKSRGLENPSIIVFEKGTHSIKHRKEFDKGSHEVIRGTYKVKKVEGNKIYVTGTDKFISNFAIQDEEERVISGPLMLADTPIYRNDQNGEYYVQFSKETIKKIAQKFFRKGYQQNVNLMHDSGSTVEGLTMFESFIKDSKRGIKAMAGFEDVPDGSWFGSFKVENEDVWKLIKDGKVRGFSVEGVFNYRKTGEKNYQEMWEQILAILNEVK